MSSVHFILGQQEIIIIYCAINVGGMPIVISIVLWNIEEYMSIKYDFKLQQ
jgi:hypothetical protein